MVHINKRTSHQPWHKLWLCAPSDFLGYRPLHVTSIRDSLWLVDALVYGNLPALAPLRYRCWSLGSAAVTYPDIRLGWLLPVSSSLLIWDYIPCVLSIYGMNWVPPSMLTFLPELSFDNIIRKNCSLEYPDHKSENIKFYINPLIISSGCMKYNSSSNMYINKWCMYAILFLQLSICSIFQFLFERMKWG